MASRKRVAYGVFDFGGGTTDFDFGIEYIPENRRRNFVIEQFGLKGDVLLGGIGNRQAEREKFLADKSKEVEKLRQEVKRKKLAAEAATEKFRDELKR